MMDKADICTYTIIDNTHYLKRNFYTELHIFVKLTITLIYYNKRKE